HTPKFFSPGSPVRRLIRSDPSRVLSHLALADCAAHAFTARSTLADMDPFADVNDDGVRRWNATCIALRIG
ncbi:MAG TPA: hypothetical protein VN920_09450, partial [Pyrinomonadaceae bacterium]|nr:hypothetical protein [Pyrinomonadaceae bacterium]